MKALAMVRFFAPFAVLAVIAVMLAADGWLRWLGWAALMVWGLAVCLPRGR